MMRKTTRRTTRSTRKALKRKATTKSAESNAGSGSALARQAVESWLADPPVEASFPTDPSLY